MVLSAHYQPDSDSDSVSTITFESCRCREREQLEQLQHDYLSEVLSVNASLRRTVKRLSHALHEKEEEMLEMQEVHEMKMLDMLKTKLVNTSASTSPSTSASCHRQGKSSSSQENSNNYSASYQRETPMASKATNAKARDMQGPQNEANKMSWYEIKSKVSYCGKSMLNKVKNRASLRTIPKEVVLNHSILNSLEVENMSSLTN